MPVQHTIFGQNLPFRALPRRFIALLSVIGLFILTFVLFGPPATSTAELKETLKHPQIPSVPDKLNPFGPSSHKPPPEQKNSTSGTISWLTDWNWKNPFSSTVALDENRAVLPPLKQRYPVYTFYDDKLKKDEANKKAENELLLIWRRAWWAQGFQPIVLSRAEAEHNPLYKAVQLMDLKANPELEVDLARWLAWGTMGTGIVANWLALPIAPYQDNMLSYLRKGEYPPGITKLNLGNGIFYGDKASINDVIKKISMKAPADILKAKSVSDLENFKVEKKVDAFAFYDRNTIKFNYKTVAAKLASNNTAEALTLLGELINGHLHVNWQNTFSDGVAVLKPLPQHTSVLLTEAIDLARNLTKCPATPIPASCPPNRPKCTPCVSSRREIQFLQHYRNTSSLYTIGVVPHPYTLTSLHYQLDDITAAFLRREAASARDMWLFAVTKELLGTAMSSEARVVRFKESVAGAHGVSHSLWLTAERESHKDLDWIFGFRLPRDGAPDGGKEPTLRPLKADVDHPPSADALAEEARLLAKARVAIRSSMKGVVVVREMVESWNLADTEAWKFARAFSARRRVEREKWEEEERRFAGAESRTSGWRWLDGK